MEYPTLMLEKLPHGYHHGSVYPLIHFHIENSKDFSKGDQFREDYLDFILNEIATLLENKLVFYQPAIIGRKNRRIVVVFKDNCDEVQIIEKGREYLKEVNYFTSNSLKAYFGVSKVMLLEKDKEIINPFKKKRIGQDYLTSDEYYQHIITDNVMIDNPKATSITPLSEYRMLKKAQDDGIEIQ